MEVPVCSGETKRPWGGVVNPALPKHQTSGVSLRWPGRQILYLMVTLAMCLVHLLLPIERGFPVLRIATYPVTLPIIIDVGAAALLLIESWGKFLRWPLNGYVVCQLTVVWAFLISVLVSRDREAGLFVVLNYSMVFVINFLTLSYLFWRGFRESFVTILCLVASLAAIVGILEGLFRYYLPFYRDLFLNYDFARMGYAMMRPDFRALGTLGNPIIYAVALCLCVPFAMELKNHLIRNLVIGLLLLASFFSISLTAIVLLAILLVGFLRAYRRKMWFVFLAALLLLSFLLGTVQAKGLDEDTFLQWSAKFSFENSNIQIRLSRVSWALERFSDRVSVVQVLFGEGLKSANKAVAYSFGGKATLDNTYMNLLLDSGLLGLGAYLLMALTLVWQFRWGAHKSLHWYNLLGMLAIGMSFETPFYATFNFVWVASVAVLATDVQNKRNRVRLGKVQGAREL